MVKIEFESINELKEFIELIPVNQKEQVTTVTMAENKHFLPVETENNPQKRKEKGMI